MPKILIVDDDRATSTLLRTLFQIEGYEGVICPRPEEVVQTIEQARPDLVLMDVHLADVDSINILAAIRVDRVINCTGPQPDIRKVASPLLQRLTDRGLIVPHELNLGIEATADGRIIDSDGNAQADFLTLGTLLRGALWESTAVPELRVQAAGVARHLVNLLATRTTP